MLRYNLRLAMLSIKRHPVLSGLMIAAIGVGIGACMSMLTVYHLSDRNPIPEKSDQLFAVQLDNEELPADYDPEVPDQPPQQISWTDAQNLLQFDQPDRQAAMFKSAFSVQPSNSDIPPFLAMGRVTSRDFFGLFNVPFRYGGVWSEEEAEAASQVVVLSRDTNERLFGDEDSTGRSLMMDEREFRVAGVLEQWRPSPKFFDITNGEFNDVEELYMPLSLTVPLQLNTSGNTNCNGDVVDGFDDFMASECRWISYWVEFADPSRAADYSDSLRGYIESQQALGRFEKPANYSVLNVTDYLTEQGVAPDDVKIMVWLSFMFLLVCLLNTVGLILAKLMARSPQIALRRALGASRVALFKQYIIEIMLIGLFGGLLGIGLSMLGLLGIKSLMRSDALIFQMDWVMIAAAIGISLLASLLAGLYPAMRVASMPPAAALKTQ